MKLIDKDTLVAEIERLRKIQPIDEFQPKEQNKIDWLAGKEFAIITLQVFLDALEVKEVDLEKELDYDDYINFFEKHPNYSNGDWGFDECWVFAKYFFELGLKAQKGE